MNKRIAKIFVLLMLLTNAMPMFAVAQEKNGIDSEPYEKVIAETGNWYSEQFTVDGKANLVVKYLGNYEAMSFTGPMEFSLGEKTVLRGIYLPFAAAAAEPLLIQISDDKGNTYPPFAAQPVDIRPDAAADKAEVEVMTEADGPTNYVYSPIGDIILEEGHYQMSLSDMGAATGTYLIKGISYAANERMKAEADEVGNTEFIKVDPDDYQYVPFENPPAKKPATFAFDQPYIVDEIIINTYNEGAGALPGTITISDESGKSLYSAQSQGGSLGDAANGTWTVAPKIMLPAGNYIIIISEPGVMNYDKNGDPLFYVKVSVPQQLRYDFTGTYQINLDAIKTSTIMGPVSEGESSFSLKDFELTVLDKDGEIELIGKYQNMPFSQNCKIVEESENTITAAFHFAADLRKLPYKAQIGAQIVVILTKPDDGNAQIRLDGTGSFERAESADKGADHNTYAIKANGRMVNKDLPAFVMTAIGKSEGVGNIPGPDTPVQAAAGMLFPPLVGLVVSVVQDMLKPKPKAKPVIRDKGWYKTRNPNLSDEALAMVMLADAMGNTDNPDLEDGESVGDNESSGSADSGGEASEDYEEETGYESDQVYESDQEDEMESGYEEQTETPPEASAETPPETPAEPEEMILKTSANGAESHYVKDPETGEWINSETGGVLDYEKYKSTFENQMEEDKKFNDKEFEKISKGDTDYDRDLRDKMKEIADAEKKEAVLNTLKSKYGTNDEAEILRIVNERQIKDQESFETWQTIGNINAAGEIGATVVGTVADTAVDGLSSVTPGGSYVKGIYKVTKGVAGTMADKGVNLGSATEGAIKGGSDAVGDLIKFKNPLGNAAAKAVNNIVGEAGGSAAGAAIRGGDEDWVSAGAQGAVDGTFKATVGTITDGIVGDAPDVSLPKGPVQITSTMKNVLVNKASGEKIASGLTDEFVVKPLGAQPIKDVVKDALKKDKK